MLVPYRRYRYSWVIVAAAVGLSAALASSGASAAGPRCAGHQALRDCAAALVSGVVSPSQCPAQMPPPGSGPVAETTADRLQNLIEDVPCANSGHVSYDATDNLGESMSVLDTIPDPDGGYLGVYHTQFRGTAGGLDFRISLAHSTDLLDWTRIEVLDPSGASMPTLRPIAGARGYLLAYEKESPQGGDFVRIRYYRTLDALLVDRYAAQKDLPRMFSPFNNGTPTILWTHWNGSLGRSVIELGFHYESAPRGARGPDREAIGVLRGFRSWTARTDPTTDIELDRQGLMGSHGDWRQFSFDGGRWRLYEAQTSFGNFGTWRVMLDYPSTGQMYSLSLRTGSRAVSSSFANPVASVEPAPRGGGEVLVVTMFLFSARAREQAGELVYYQPF